jgi:hypothetical protein
MMENQIAVRRTRFPEKNRQPRGHRSEEILYGFANQGVSRLTRLLSDLQLFAATQRFGFQQVTDRPLPRTSRTTWEQAARQGEKIRGNSLYSFFGTNCAVADSE